MKKDEDNAMSEQTRHELVVGGTGGQGVITIGYALAGAAAGVYKYVTRFPIYAATQRGGPAYATVIFSQDEIAAPILSRTVNAIAMETGSYSRLRKETKAGGRLFINSSIVKKTDPPQGYQLYDIPVTDLAQEMGSVQMANIIMLGVYRQVTGVLSDELLLDYLAKDAGEARMDRTRQAYARGLEFAKGKGW
jgi:2-oxoglutarate ferredoxin oxidoreductase subunit gamma